MFLDQAIHLRLCKAGVITFIVPMAAVAHHIQEDIFIKTLAVFDSQLRCFYYSFRVITIHMQYRCFYHRGYAGAIVGGAGIVKIGSKAYLVIDDKMYSTAGRVTLQF